MKKIVISFFAVILLASAGSGLYAQNSNDYTAKLNRYASCTLKYDAHGLLKPTELEMLSHLIGAAEMYDAIYWEQVFGRRNLTIIKKDKNNALRQYAELQYGAWDRLDGDKPLLQGFKERPAGINFYPADMTLDEFSKLKDAEKNSPYTLLRRGENKTIKAIPFDKAFGKELTMAQKQINFASSRCEDDIMRIYLENLGNNIFKYDNNECGLMWKEMRMNKIGFIAGATNNGDDNLLGIKASFGAILVAWDEEQGDRYTRLADIFRATCQELQKNTSENITGYEMISDIRVYNELYRAGFFNAGIKRNTVTLPLDAAVQEKGASLLILKNTTETQYAQIISPVANITLDPKQRKNLSLDAYTLYSCCREAARTLLGIVDKEEQPIGDEASILYRKAWREAAAELCALSFMKALVEHKATDGVSEANLAAVFTAAQINKARLDANTAEGLAGRICLGILLSHNTLAVTQSGTIAIKEDVLLNSSEKLAVFAIDNKAGIKGNADNIAKDYGTLDKKIKTMLDNTRLKNIPLDIRYEQGYDVLGIQPAEKPATKDNAPKEAANDRTPFFEPRR